MSSKHTEHSKSLSNIGRSGPAFADVAPQDMLFNEPRECAQLGPLVIGDNATL